MIYQYKALLNGVEQLGKMEAGSEAEVTEYLRANNYFPIDVREAQSGQIVFLNKILSKVTLKDITYLTRQLAIMLNAGLTLIGALEIIKKQTKKDTLREVIDSLDKNLREGKNFSQALERFPQYFSTFYVALIKSGEASGKLDMILGKLAEHLEEQADFQRKVKGALVYPSIIITAMFGLIFVMVTFVTPKLLELYTSFNVELPVATRYLIAISSFMQTYWIVVLLVIVGLVILLKRIVHSERGKVFYDTHIINFPVFGNIIKTSALVDTTRTLAILILSGVPILDGLSIVTEVNENTMFKQAFKRVTAKVEKGMSVGTALSNEGIFPESLVQMTIVGEQTGHLDETLARTSAYYQIEAENAIKTMLTLIEPVILVVLAIVVGGLVVAVISPIFSLTSSL